MARSIELYKFKENDSFAHYKCWTDPNDKFYVLVEKKSGILVFFIDSDLNVKAWEYNLSKEIQLVPLKFLKLSDVAAAKAELHKAWLKQEFPDSLSKFS